MHKMGGTRVWRGEGDESADQGEAFDKWLEIMWTNLAKLEAAAKADSLDDPEDIPADEEEDDDDEDDDEDDEEPLVNNKSLKMV